MAIIRKRKKSSKIIIATLLLVFLAPFILYGYRIMVIEKESSANIFGDAPSTASSDIKNKITKPPETATPAKVTTIPSDALLAVPYTRQAPFSVWDALHEDACEEASFLMVKHYLDGTPIDSKQAIDNEIIAMVHYEEQNGYGTSITLEQLATIAKNKYGMTGTVIKNATNDDMKREIASGKPIIIGAAGKILPNPYFKNGGPIYHMLVIKGFNSKNFITNDPGTMKGDGFEYSFADLYNSIHDWDPTNIMNGQKAYLVF